MSELPTTRMPLKTQGRSLGMELLRFYLDVVKLALRHSLDQTQYILIVILLLVGAGGYFVPKLANWETIVTGSQAALTVLGSIVAARLLLAPYWLYKEKVEALNSAIASTRSYSRASATDTSNSSGSEEQYVRLWGTREQWSLRGFHAFRLGACE